MAVFARTGIARLTNIMRNLAVFWAVVRLVRRTQPRPSENANSVAKFSSCRASVLAGASRSNAPQEGCSDSGADALMAVTVTALSRGLILLRGELGAGP